ncbi:MAG: CehA/McbA family metallohydrolase, partial [Gemmatimonadaceae bacterium]
MTSASGRTRALTPVLRLVRKFREDPLLADFEHPTPPDAAHLLTQVLVMRDRCTSCRPDQREFRRLLVLLAVLGATPVASADAQWTNRYPKNNGFNHHVYLEGYELPTLAAGVLDPAISPDGRSIALASRGWLWLMDVTTGEATRLTSGAGVDSRPAWSKDGQLLAFVRDDSRTTAVMVRDMTSGAEREIDRGMSLDPAFGADGRTLYFASVAAGDLDIWRSDLTSGEKTRVTTATTGIELRPIPLPDGTLLYVAKTRGGQDEVRHRTPATGVERSLLSGSIISNLRPAVSPDGKLLAFSWPTEDGWELRLASVDRAGVSISLVHRTRGRPLTPAWSADGRWVYYVESDRDQVMQLWRVSSGGGAPQPIRVLRWSWGGPTGRVVIRTRAPGGVAPLSARLNVTDASGHPLIPDRGQPRFDAQNGTIYFYSSGAIEVTAPIGRVTVRAVHGLATPERTTTADARAGEATDLTLELTPLWDAQANGWYSGDHHFHLNYGGQFDLLPEDLVPAMQGEDLDVGTPMLANLHNRFGDQSFWRFARLEQAPLIKFAQEVRPHFLGHVGLIGTDELFWPWVWGPGYEVYGRDDRASMTALDAGRAQGGLGTYVHPILPAGDPFVSAAGLNGIPVGIIPDVVLGHVDLLEVACLFSDELATSELWYRFLNIGVPIASEGGTDAMTDLHRTMALGATRVYVRPDGAFNLRSYLDALKAGRSFVTNGPLLDVRVGDRQPGDVIDKGGARVPFRIALHSAVPVERVEVLVNGTVAWSAGKVGIDSSGSRDYTGEVALPLGGWVAVRAVGPKTTRWPAMDSYAFAHTSPIWIARRGSTDGVAERAAARDLLQALDVAEKRLVDGYAGSDIPVLRAHFQRARQELER